MTEYSNDQQDKPDVPLPVKSFSWERFGPAIIGGLIGVGINTVAMLVLLLIWRVFIPETGETITLNFSGLISSDNQWVKLLGSLWILVIIIAIAVGLLSIAPSMSIARRSGRSLVPDVMVAAVAGPFSLSALAVVITLGQADIGSAISALLIGIASSIGSAFWIYLAISGRLPTKWFILLSFGSVFTSGIGIIALAGLACALLTAGRIRGYFVLLFMLAILPIVVALMLVRFVLQLIQADVAMSGSGVSSDPMADAMELSRLMAEHKAMGGH